jgi:hypothetical protein
MGMMRVLLITIFGYALGYLQMRLLVGKASDYMSGLMQYRVVTSLDFSQLEFMIDVPT